MLQGLCSNVDIVKAFHVSTDSVRRWKKKLSERGEAAFFGEEKRHGHSHALLPDVVKRIQEKLNPVGGGGKTGVMPKHNAFMSRHSVVGEGFSNEV